jgi:hypothetical protein
LYDNQEKKEERFEVAAAKLVTGTDLVILKGEVSQSKITEEAIISWDTG